MNHDMRTSNSRRDFIKGLAGTAAVAAVMGHGSGEASAQEKSVSGVELASNAPAILESEFIEKFKFLSLKGNIKHSLVNWCYRPWFKNMDDFCNFAVKLGCKSIELIPPENWQTLKKYDLTCAIASSHGFANGFNNKGEWNSCTDRLLKMIDSCKEFGVKSLITFTGMANGISKEAGGKNFIEGIKTALKHAEQNKVTLCLEMLNTRDNTHKMKGHPGYQGDHCDYCIDLIKQVGSPYLKLLFDIYHVQIMDGDVIRRIKQHAEYIGHIHTAGNPGRGELDMLQEINYPAVMKALLEVKYQGYVGHEYIPTRDVAAGLVEAVKFCDV